jgi:hypothetical protein
VKGAAKLAVFWADTRELLTWQERKAVMSKATIESITPSEMLLRTSVGRLVAVTTTDEEDLYCSFCYHDGIRAKFGGTCPDFARCAKYGRHRGIRLT